MNLEMVSDIRGGIGDHIGVVVDLVGLSNELVKGDSEKSKF